MQDRGQGFSPGVIRASFGRSAKAFDRAAKRGDPLAIPFGRYLLLDRIKRGGMAEVYRAKAVGHEGFEKVVAIKRILPHLAANEDFVTMFIDEAKIVSYLNHQNICPVIELGRCEDGLYIVMEYIWGRDLRQILNALARTGRLMPINVAVYIAARISEGLDYAHRRKGPTGQRLDIVHRDISPQNVLISFDGEVKIIDFGIASASQRSTETRAGTFKGKFAYMSPEQARGQQLDRRSDVFAAGILLHEMVTGSRLFAGKTDLETLDRVRNCDVPVPSRPFEDIPPELVEIAMKALHRDPEQRYQWAGELQESLDRYLLLSGELASASRLGTWVCINFSEEAAKALIDQERAARAKPAGEDVSDAASSSQSAYDMQADGKTSGPYSEHSSDASASASVSVSESVAEPVSRSVSEVADDVELGGMEGAFDEAFEVDEDAFASAPPAAPAAPAIAEATFGERPTEPPLAEPPADDTPPDGLERPDTAPSQVAMPAEHRPAAPPPDRAMEASESYRPESGAFGAVRQDSAVNVPAQKDSPESKGAGNKRRKKRLDPVQVEYSPWNRFASSPEDSSPPSEDEEDTDGGDGDLLILDEPPPKRSRDDD